MVSQRLTRNGQSGQRGQTTNPERDPSNEDSCRNRIDSTDPPCRASTTETTRNGDRAHSIHTLASVAAAALLAGIVGRCSMEESWINRRPTQVPAVRSGAGESWTALWAQDSLRGGTANEMVMNEFVATTDGPAPRGAGVPGTEGHR